MVKIKSVIAMALMEYCKYPEIVTWIRLTSQGCWLKTSHNFLKVFIILCQPILKYGHRKRLGNLDAVS